MAAKNRPDTPAKTLENLSRRAVCAASVCSLLALLAFAFAVSIILLNRTLGNADQALETVSAWKAARIGEIPGQASAAVPSPDAEKTLYPLLEYWPIPYVKGESFLLGGSGETAKYLSPLDGMPDAPGKAVPSSGKAEAERLAAGGRKGSFTARDYRGALVRAYVLEIPRTGILLVSTADMSSILAPWRTMMYLLAIFLAAAAAAVVLAGRALANRRTAASCGKQLQDERDSRAADSKFGAFMDRMPLMVLIKDADSRIVFANVKMRENFPADIWIGRRPHEIFDPAHAERAVERDRKALAEGYVEYEEKRNDLSGRQRHLFAQEFAIAGDGGKPLIGLIVTDRTGMDEAFGEIRNLNSTLELKVRERTAELEASNAELKAFTYSVSHDLRGPLHSLDGFTQLLIDSNAKNLDGQGLHYLERIKSASRRMGELIGDLLSLSKVSMMELVKEETDIGKIADSIVSDYIQKTPGRAVSISIKPRMLAVCDPRLATILLANLIDNAFKFTSGRADSVIEIGAKREDQGEAGEIVYFIRDNGAGFDMEYAKTLFQPFHRLHSSEEFPGNGIGLAIGKRIIDRHGGRIWIESEPDRGTTVYFILNK